MTKKPVVFSLIIALMLALLVSLAVYAAGNRGPGQPGMACSTMGMQRGPGMMLQRLAVDLKLTPSQKQQIEGIWKEFRTETQSDRDAMMAKKGELLTLMASPNPDKAKAQELVGEMNAIQGKIMTAGIEKVFDAKQVLTPEQNQIVAQKVEQFKPMIMQCGMMGK